MMTVDLIFFVLSCSPPVTASKACTSMVNMRPIPYWHLCHNCQVMLNRCCPRTPMSFLGKSLLRALTGPRLAGRCYLYRRWEILQVWSCLALHSGLLWCATRKLRITVSMARCIRSPHLHRPTYSLRDKGRQRSIDCQCQKGTRLSFLMCVCLTNLDISLSMRRIKHNDSVQISAVK